MMQQYLTLKQAHADCLLLFRLGDFYELFLDDAKIASEVLDITLTARSRGSDGKIPMAGVPYHAVAGYIAKLLEAGYKVAICDQVSEPDGKGLVDRQVTRIITPGTVLDELSLEARTSNYLVCLHQNRKMLGVAVVEVSTGELLANEYYFDSASDQQYFLHELLAHYQPAEIIFSPSSGTLQRWFEDRFDQIFISTALDWPRHQSNATKVVEQHFSAPLKTLGLTQAPTTTQTLAGLFTYLQQTQKDDLQHLTTVKSLAFDRYLQLDPSTIRNLELLPNKLLPQSTSLLETIDHTTTHMGGRLLKRWLLQPLRDKTTIEARHQVIAEIISHQLVSKLKPILSQVGDLERLVGRFAAGTGTPRDLVALASSIETSQQVVSLLIPIAGVPLVAELVADITKSQPSQLAKNIRNTITDDPPTDPKVGEYIQWGVDQTLDELVKTITTNRQWMADLEETERARTGISSLKVRFNQVFGYYLEVSNSNLDKVPDDYVRKQTLVNAERFITPKMKTREEVILNAQAQIEQHNLRIFSDLVRQVVATAQPVQALAQAIATLDCLVCFAENAEQMRLVRPTITTTTELNITGGRHLVVEQLLESGTFVPNDCHLDTKENQVLLITGPNMAGKSVYMRQVALITLLAHCGSYVPATSATIGIVDRIFVRSGAADSIAQGLSTFMVEMVETAFILRHATSQSLVIMDEIGRGTSTYDGISIAWSIAEYLVALGSVRPKTLFATHYHELQALAETYPSIHNYHLAVTGKEHQPVFLYTLAKGGASSSFGIGVARLAGLPSEITERAEVMLKDLGSVKNSSAPAKNRPQPVNPTQQKIASTLRQLDIEKTTPLEALKVLADLKQLLGDRRS